MKRNWIIIIISIVFFSLLLSCSSDKKVKELIAVALSVNAHCPWCISYHVNEALKAGATPDEIREAAWVAVLMGGGPNLSYMILVEKALKEFT